MSCHFIHVLFINKKWVGHMFRHRNHVFLIELIAVGFIQFLLSGRGLPIHPSGCLWREAPGLLALPACAGATQREERGIDAMSHPWCHEHHYLVLIFVDAKIKANLKFVFEFCTSMFHHGGAMAFFQPPVGQALFGHSSCCQQQQWPQPPHGRWCQRPCGEANSLPL